jgi:ATP-dependent Lon protease
MPRETPRIPAGDLPLLPLRNGVLFPGTSTTIPVGRARSVALAKSLSRNDLIVIGTQLDVKTTEPGLTDLAPIATLARVRRIVDAGRGRYRLLVEGLRRIELSELVQSQPFLVVRGAAFDEPLGDTPDAEALLRKQLRSLEPVHGEAVRKVLATGRDPGLLADRTASILGLPAEQEIRVLSTGDIGKRLDLVGELMTEAAVRGKLKQSIDQTVRQERSQAQREHLLREQLRAIQKELGEDGPADEMGKLRERLDAKELPEDVRTAAEREFSRLQSMGPQSAESSVIRTYLEWVLDLPWLESASVQDDIDAVADALDDDHFGLDDVKKAILEHLAVLKMGGEARGTILCLAGPPGVGKTSLGQSIADATGRPFVRISLGGVRDEAEIRGHRRTYVGARPGRLMTALKQASANNAVVLLDEIDKLGQGWMGSPEAALLEVLDPEQNGTFTDHYLETPFDLSQILFLCTANDLSKVSAPLRDRLEIIQISGYTQEEKLLIARNHLIPKQLERHAIADDMLDIDDEALMTLVAGWTREAGVRQLQREIRKLCRGLALRLARAPDDERTTLTVRVDDIEELLGRRKVHSDVAERTEVPGVATGLAWTPVGGDILFVETSAMVGKGQLQITGQLGDVMKESARAALTYVRSNAEELGIDPAFLEDKDLHVHVPAGAVPKDGPSAGVTIFTALTSLLTGRKVRSDTAMTGEATLRGKVLPVGGIKAKVLAAHRAGLRRLVLPKKNEGDLHDVPEQVLEDMEIFFATDMTEVLAAALEEDIDPVSHSEDPRPEVAA